MRSIRILILGAIFVVGSFGQISQATVSDPVTVDASFRFAETNITNIHDIALFPDGRIVYGGAGRDSTIGTASPEGGVPSHNFAGMLQREARSLATEALANVVFSGGIYRDALVTRASGIENDYTYSFGSGLTGTVSKVLLQADGKLIVAGRMERRYATNEVAFGLARIDTVGALDPSFQHTNTSGIEVTTAALLADDKILTGYFSTNQAGDLEHDIARWNPDGSHDASYTVVLSLDRQARISAMERAPGTNGLMLAIDRESENGPRTSLVPLDNSGMPVGAGHPFENLEIEGRVYDIAFEAIHRETVLAGGYDRVIVVGDFTRVGGEPVRNLAVISKAGAVDWALEGGAMDGRIEAVAVQMDGKIVVGGSFTNIGSTAVTNVTRLLGHNVSGAEYLFWSNSEFRGFEREGQTTVTLERSGDTLEPLTVQLSIEPETAGSPVPSVPSRIEFAAGQTSTNLLVSFGNDTLRQNRQRFTLRASTTNFAILPTRNETTLVVLDDETPGTVDSTFRERSLGAFGSFGLQPDGKIIVNTWSTFLVRLNPDGSLDSTFVTNGIPTLPERSGQILQIEPQPDGKIYVSGRFHSTSNLYGINHLARLNADGILDTSFDPLLTRSSLSPSSGVYFEVFDDETLAVWPSIWGSIRHRDSFFPQQGFMRLGRSGELLPAVNVQSAFPGWRDSAALESLPSGELFAFGAQPGLVEKYRRDGVLDTNFVSKFSGHVFDMERSGDALLLAGWFSGLNSTVISNLARVDTGTGAVDTNFNVQVNAAIYHLRQHNGKIYISGRFTEVNGRSRNRLARLNSDGTLDESFDPGLGPNGSVFSMGIQPDGKLVAGSFSDRVDGINMGEMVRLQGDAGPGRVQFISRRIEVGGTNDFATVQIERVGGSTGPLSANVSLSEGSAMAGRDFVSTNFVVHWADGEFAPRTLQIPLLNDAEQAGNRTFTIQVSADGSSDEATVLIENTDGSLFTRRAEITGGLFSVMDFDVGPIGEIYVGGYFDAINGVAVTNLARLHMDLDVDPSFRLSEMPIYQHGGLRDIAALDAVAVRPNGQVLYASMFFNALGTTNYRYLAQVNPDGSYDFAFMNSNRVAGINSAPFQMALQPDGKLILNTAMGLMRINEGGGRDPMNPGPSGYREVVPHPDGSLYLVRDGFVKLTPEGNSFPGFSVPLWHTLNGGFMARAGAQALEILPDGTLLLGGDFKFANTFETHGVARIFTNGVVDTNFQARVGVNPPGAQGSSVTAVQPLPGGNILIAGSFASVAGEARPGLAVLSSNGTLRSDIRLPSPGAVIDEMALLTNGLILARTRATTNGVEKSTELFTFSVPEALAPVVRILSPTNNAEIVSDEISPRVSLQVQAFDPDGFVEHVVMAVDGVPVSTNKAGNFTTEVTLTAAGSHTLSVTAIDTAGQSTTETVSFNVGSAEAPPPVVLTREGGEIVVNYTGHRLQGSIDLRNWSDVHIAPDGGGGQFHDSGAEGYRFFRAVRD